MTKTTITEEQLGKVEQSLAQYPNMPAVAWGVLASFGDQYAQAAYQGIGISGSFYSSTINGANLVFDNSE